LEDIGKSMATLNFKMSLSHKKDKEIRVDLALII